MFGVRSVAVVDWRGARGRGEMDTCTFFHILSVRRSLLSVPLFLCLSGLCLVLSCLASSCPLTTHVSHRGYDLVLRSFIRALSRKDAPCSGMVGIDTRIDS